MNAQIIPFPIDRIKAITIPEAPISIPNKSKQKRSLSPQLPPKYRIPEQHNTVWNRFCCLIGFHFDTCFTYKEKHLRGLKAPDMYCRRCGIEYYDRVPKMY